MSEREFLGLLKEMLGTEEWRNERGSVQGRLYGYFFLILSLSIGSDFLAYHMANLEESFNLKQHNVELNLKSK